MFFRKKPAKPRVFVLSLDGVPYTLLQRAFQEDRLPHLRALFTGNGTFRQMHSVIPTISSVAWSTFQTGRNPGKHGIFGFVDRDPHTLKMYIPTGAHIRTNTLWEVLSEAGKRVVVMNVPNTTPPRRVNGVLVAGFLSMKLEKAVYPDRYVAPLRNLGYVIDVNPMLAQKDLHGFVDRLKEAVQKRKEATFYFMKEISDWDFFMVHIMETDRIMHFLWAQMEENDPEFAPRFWEFFRLVDETVAEIHDALPENTLFISLSDHGFTRVKAEVNTNYWLREKGYLKFKTEEPRDLVDMDSTTRVYSLIPGRFYINLLGREAAGSVVPEEYETWRERLLNEIPEIRDPETGKAVIQKVWKREDLYWGPLVKQAADVIAHPVDGYDLKAQLAGKQLTLHTHINGMHTYDDAYLFVENTPLRDKDPVYLYDVTQSILQALAVPAPEDMDGESLLP